MFDHKKHQEEINENVHEQLVQEMMDDARKGTIRITVERMQEVSQKLMDDLQQSTLTTFPK